MKAQVDISDPSQPRKSQAMQDFETLIERLASEATPADREKIADLVNPAGTVRIDDPAATWNAALVAPQSSRVVVMRGHPCRLRGLDGGSGLATRIEPIRPGVAAVRLRRVLGARAATLRLRACHRAFRRSC